MTAPPPSRVLRLWNPDLGAWEPVGDARVGAHLDDPDAHAAGVKLSADAGNALEVRADGLYGTDTTGGAGAVTSVNGETGDVELSAADVGALGTGGGTVTGATTFNVRVTVAGVAQPRVSVQEFAPSSPATGDLWVW